MANKYDSFIELTPGYESVVDISSDSRNADFWSRYIVNEDMVTAVKLLASSLRPDDPNEDVWHYWIKGSYGTGKTYSAIVIKHLLQDDYGIVENFLNKNKLFFDVKDKFLAARKKARYYVKFRSGESKQLSTSNKFLFQIEQSVRDILKENGFCYTGRNSLVDSVRSTVKDFRPKLAQDFENGEYPECWSIYDTFDSFYDAVQDGDITACSSAQEILQSMNIGLATDLETFKAWLKDVYSGNEELSKSGIFIIWDEFTEYIRNNDLDIIQQLSIFSKELPFFIIYVMHEYPGLFSESVNGSLGKADARFHKIDVSLSKKTTFKLIGESIITRDGMKGNWEDICEDLYSSISGSVHSYMGDPDTDMDANTLKKIFPIHPMTVNLVSMVAGLAASNRSIFEFLKSSGDDGFRAYIHNNGQYDWKWVTPDYLWDYFFVNNLGGKKDLTKTAEDALKHYSKVKNLISDDRALRVFKVAMLLLATIGTGHSLKKTRGSKGIQVTEKTLCDCFSGIMDKDSVKSYLQSLSSDPLNILVLAPDLHEGSRIELPYSGTGGELDVEIEKLKKDNSPAKLLGADSYFGSILKKQFVPDEKAVVKRLIVDTCWGTTQQLNFKFGELKKAIEKTHYKFGLLIVAVPSVEESDKIKTTISGLIADDETHRVLVTVMRYPLPEEIFRSWYELVANGSLAQRAGNTVNANSYQTQAVDLVGNWVSTAIGKDMDLLYGDTPAHVYTNKNVISNYEKIVFRVFPAAPENIIRKITLYKSPAAAPAYYGVSKTTLETKSAANDKQKNFNQQWQDCVDVLRDNDENVWDCGTIEDIMAMTETKVGRSMASLCAYLNKALTSGTVLLTDLWDDMQQKLGYYDTSVCCYLLGFAFHFYIGKFTWYDGNNAHKLDEDTIPTMIVSMLSGKSAGMKLSSESDIEKRFKDITRRIFALTPEEIGDVYDCRKNVKIHITKNGYPFWALKYLEDIDYAGIKTEICEIVDKYVEYILEIGSQTAVMEDIVSLVKVNAKAYVPLLTDLFKDKSKLANGMKRFVFETAPDAENTCKKYNFSIDMLFNMLSKALEEEKWQWRENEVAEATVKLTIDLTLVGVVNSALNGTAESVEKIKETLSNYLDYIRVPGCVYAGLPNSWAKTVATLHNIASGKWIGYSSEEKAAIISELELYTKDAIENISHPMNVLKAYIAKNGMGTFSDAECSDILQALQKEPYSQTEHSFKTAIRNKINDLAYTKQANSLLAIWLAKTDTAGVAEWAQTYMMPVAWVMPNCTSIFSVASALSRNERIDSIRLENALNSITETDLAVLKDKNEIDRCFIVNVASEKYHKLLLPHIDELKIRIQDNGYRDYSSWNNSVVAIRKITEKFITTALRDEVSGNAKKKAAKMTEEQLRAKLIKLLDSSAEACLFLLDED
jgi:hypothetical protein